LIYNKMCNPLIIQKPKAEIGLKFIFHTPTSR